jgi:predicted MFS family arabinose efflux permease
MDDVSGAVHFCAVKYSFSDITQFYVLMIARIIPAFLHPVFWAVATVAASKQLTKRCAQSGIGGIGRVNIATVLGVPLQPMLAELINWKASFLVSGVINLIAFVALMAFVPSMPVTEKQS